MAECSMFSKECKTISQCSPINALTPSTTALKTLKKYMKYIENMFKSNITNGLIEGLNNKIKSIKRIAFGYLNFSNFKKCRLIQTSIISISA